MGKAGSVAVLLLLSPITTVLVKFSNTLLPLLKVNIRPDDAVLPSTLSIYRTESTNSSQVPSIRAIELIQ